jgi:hypothetical protein
MSVVTTVVCVIATAVVVWGLTKASAIAKVARVREELTGEIRYWQAIAEQARHHAAQLSRDANAWAAGHRQGRDDAIAIMPIIAEAHEKLTDAGLGAAGLTDAV